MMKRSAVHLFIISMAVILFTGCTSVEKIPSSGKKGKNPITLSSLENHVAGEDPWEGFNRSMFSVTSFFMDYVAHPLGTVYCSIVPRPVIRHFSNLCTNLEYPARFFSCLLRGHWRGAGDETARFFINSTVGIAGLFDPAAYWLHIHPTGSDFGQTFASWGIAPGETFVLPASSNTNVRDAVGSMFDSALDIKSYIPYSGAATALNGMVLGHRAFSQVAEGSNDRYKSFREMSTLNRQLQLRMFRYHAAKEKSRLLRAGKLFPPPAPTPPVAKPEWMQGKWLELKGYGPGSAVLDSLRVLLFRAQDDDSFWYLPLSVFNDTFSQRRLKRALSLSPERPDFVYSFWPSPEKNVLVRKEKLAVLLPGIGGTAASSTPTAYAQLLNKNGYAVLVIDSTFTWQFVVSRSGCRLPGFLPSDAAAVRKVIRLAIDDLKKDKLLRDPETILTGYSFGGMHTLKIAELESRDPQLFIKKYLAVNPPASLKYAVSQADKMAQAMNAYTPEQVIDKALVSAGNIMAAMTVVLEPYHEKVPVWKKSLYQLKTAPEMANFVAGLYLRASMRSMLFSAHQQRGLDPLAHIPAGFRRNKLYLELDKVTFSDYAEKYLLVEYPGVKLSTLYAKSDLRSIAGTLKDNEKVFMLHAQNDFLLSEDDKKFLDSALKKRILWTSRGGHLGQLYYKSVQQSILKMLE